MLPNPDEYNLTDEYVRVQRLQNLGGVCPYCQSSNGHFSKCELITNIPGAKPDQVYSVKNPQVLTSWGKKYQPKPIEESKHYQEILNPSESDRIQAKGLGIQL